MLLNSHTFSGRQPVSAHSGRVRRHRLQSRVGRQKHIVTALEAPKDTGTNDKDLETMRKFSEQYARRLLARDKLGAAYQLRDGIQKCCNLTGTYFCSDLSVTSVVIKGLAEHKTNLGAPLCPCRHYDDKKAEVAQGFWNCPCVPMRERKECHCMLFLTEDNGFRGDGQAITMESIKETTDGMSGVQP